MNDLHLSLTFEAMPGSDINDVARELCRVATLLGVGVEAKLNGGTLSAGPWDEPEHVVRTYLNLLESDRQRAAKRDAKE